MYLYGASGHAKVIIEILENLGVSISGIFDDNPDIKELMGYPVNGAYKQVDQLSEPLIISIGNNMIRKKIDDLYHLRYGLAFHPSAQISSRVSIGFGTVIMGHSILNAETKVGKHVIINTSASIDHDCIIGDYVHISPNATLCGGVIIGEGVHIGAAAVIIPGVRIGKWSIIGAGSVVIKDIPEYATVV
ncbi:MAG: acetyltransferase, partial [Chloroflexota bacterium]